MMVAIETVLEVLTLAIGVVTPLFGAVWFLIQSWRKAQERVKKMEAKEVLSSVRQLEQKLSEHKESIDKASALQAQETKSLQDSFRQIREELIKIQARLEVASKDEERLVKLVEDMRLQVDRRLKTLEDTVDDGEIVRLGENQFMFRARRRHQG